MIASTCAFRVSLHSPYRRSIRTFDPHSQRKVEDREDALVLPAAEFPLHSRKDAGQLARIGTSRPRESSLVLSEPNRVHPRSSEIAAGTRIRALAHFDNSSWNPFNPDPEQRTRLGAANARLGADLVLGDELEDRGSKFRVCVGPLGARSFRRSPASS